MAATVTRSPAEMVTEADEIVRKAREVAWPESREAQNAIGHEAAKALRNRLAEWKRREGGILS